MRLTVLFLLLILITNLSVIRAEEYLSAGEIAAIGGGALAIGILGHNFYRSEISVRSLIGGPLPGEMRIMEFLAGDYYYGKTNFLDNDNGALLTPFVFGAMLLTTDLVWPQTKSGKDAGQDMFLYGSGLAVTKGLTGLSKAIFRRPRPFTSLSDPSMLAADYDNRNLYTSFFSGHTSGAFFSAAFLNLRLRSILRHRWSADEYSDWSWTSPAIIYGWAAFVAWSRMHAYRHYPTDVIVGALVGYLIAELFYSWGFESSEETPSEATLPVLKISFSF